MWTQIEFQKKFQFPFEKIKLISKFVVKYSKKKRCIHYLVSMCHANIDHFHLVNFSVVTQVFIDWVSFIQLNAFHLLHFEDKDSKDEEEN